MSFGAVRRMLRREQPEVVLLACTGPVIAALLAAPELRGPDRPVLVTGMPGVSVPASPRAVALRAGCDLLVVHSRREQAEYAALAAQLAPSLAVGLATLPFLADSTSPPAAPAERPDLVFAAQAKVPETRTHREAILLALAETESPVVKLRATGGEPQTHRELWPYPVLADDLVRQGRVGSNAIRFTSWVDGRCAQYGAGADHGVVDGSPGSHGRGRTGADHLRLRSFGGPDQPGVRRLGLSRHPGRPPGGPVRSARRRLVDGQLLPSGQ